MFKIPLLNRHTVVSDEGFKVTFISRNILKYEEGDLVARLNIDGDGKRMDLLAHSIRIESTQNGQTSKDEERHRIVRNVVRVLEWKGWSAHVLH